VFLPQLRTAPDLAAAGRRRRRSAFCVGLAASLTLVGCQDQYPIPATRCDRLCDLTKGTQCDGYNPAGCVVMCEEGTNRKDCEPQFDALLGCLEAHRQELICDHTGLIQPCQSEQDTQKICLARRPPANR